MGTIRLSGMISGLDTDSIIKELVNAQKLKNKKTTDKLTLSEWKEDKWKELNAKLYKLYTEDLNNLRLQGSYATKKTTSSNDSLVSVKGSPTAPQGAHVLTIEQLASSQYVTGGKMDNGKTITTSTTLKEIGMTPNTTINIASNGKSQSLLVTEKTTLNDFINACKNVGLNASYDTTQKRLFISSAKSGASNAFTITTDATSFNDIKNIAGFGSLDAAGQKSVTDAINALKGTSDTELTDLYSKAENNTPGANEAEQKKIDAINVLKSYTTEKVQKSIMQECINIVKQTDVIADVLEIHAKDENGNDNDPATQKMLAIKAEIKTRAEEQIAAGKLNLGETEIDDYVDNLYTTSSDSDKEIIFSQAIDRKYASDTAYSDAATAAYNSRISDETYDDTALADLKTKLTAYLGNSAGDLSALGLSEISGAKVEATGTNTMTVVEAADAAFTLDGAKLTSSTNSLVVNGMTLNLKGKTAVGETISLEVSNDTQAAYDMVKNFINSYNAILKEMNSLYYANSASGYAPLSDDEREAMTDDQIEKWETKIKDSVLRRDTTLGTAIEAIKSSMMSSVTVDGKKYSLATFGITTSTDYTEKGLLHIYGNKDDSTYADQTDKLMKGLTTDPDNTIKALSGIFQNLYDTMTEKMSSIPNVRSIYTVYNDKLMDKEQTDYKKRITVLENKLTAMENKYYKQFSAMETALAKLQSQSNSLAGLLGNSSK